MSKQGRAWRIVLVVTLLSAGCATSPVDRANAYRAKGEWLKVVLEYRKARAATPDDVEFVSRLRQAELDAAEYYYHSGSALAERGELELASAEFEKGLVAMPQHAKLIAALNAVLKKSEANRRYAEAERNWAAGRAGDAKNLLVTTLELEPGHRQAKALLAEIGGKEEEPHQATRESRPITVNFRETEARTAFEFVAKAVGVNVIVDEGVKNERITLFAKEMEFKKVLDLMTSATKTFFRWAGAQTLVIAPDTSEKRGQYQDHLIRTFYLRTAKAKNMSDLIKGVLKVDKIVINEEMNSLIIRDTQGVIDLVEKLVLANDRKPAEMILEVEILEVNRNKAEQLGLDFGSMITAEFNEFPVSGSWPNAFKAGTVTLPTLTFRYFKQDVDAKTLASPKVRVIDRRDAKIHIGDRVPLRSSTIQDATGQVRTTFEYKDIGIRLSLLPEIHLDNSVTVKLGLEVSTLGQNLGTQAEPAFSIGTRNADTFMLLRDGETAILGGLIRDEDRNTRIKIPGLGDIPALGALFTTYDDSSGRTDILLTITPRVVRPWDLPPLASREIYSGNATRYSTKPVFPFTADEPSGPAFRLGPPAKAEEARTRNNTMQGRSPQAEPQRQDAGPAVLAFEQALYEVEEGEEFILNLTGQGFEGGREVPVDLLFNHALLEVAGTASGRGYEETSDGISLVLKGTSEPSVLEGIRMRARKAGVSYLMHRVARLRTSEGTTMKVDTRSSRVAIQGAKR